MRFLSRLLLPLVSLSSAVSAVSLDITDESSIKEASATLAYAMVKWYTGNNTGDVPGNLPSPYYWWEAGSFFGELIEYWYYTGDTTYNNITKQAIIHQIGDDKDFMPANQTKSLGNDDQVMWAFTAMTAAELKFEDPDDDDVSWVGLAQAVFNEQVSRWDTSVCGGGLRWQIYTFNVGYDYKNIISNGGLFQLAARLAYYTGNTTYAEWAEKIWDWIDDTSPLMDQATWSVYDGTSTTENCSDADHTQWTYNYGTFLSGTAFLYNMTTSSNNASTTNATASAMWKTRLDGLMNTTLETFFPTSMGPNILVEVACEPYGTCDNDQPAFKALTVRWLVLAAQLARHQWDNVFNKLKVSAQGAAGQCCGTSTRVTGTAAVNAVCGREWNSTTWDGIDGVGEQMSGLSVVQAMMMTVKDLAAPVTVNTGGTSKSQPSAGSSGSSSSDPTSTESDTITAGDKAGASILTIVLVLGSLAGAGWMVGAEKL